MAEPGAGEVIDWDGLNTKAGNYTSGKLARQPGTAARAASRDVAARQLAGPALPEAEATGDAATPIESEMFRTRCGRLTTGSVGGWCHGRLGGMFLEHQGAGDRILERPGIEHVLVEIRRTELLEIAFQLLAILPRQDQHRHP